MCLFAQVHRRRRHSTGEGRAADHGACVKQEAVKDAREEREASVESSGGHHAKEQRKACKHLAAAAPN